MALKRNTRFIVERGAVIIGRLDRGFLSFLEFFIGNVHVACSSAMTSFQPHPS